MTTKCFQFSLMKMVLVVYNVYGYMKLYLKKKILFSVHNLLF